MLFSLLDVPALFLEAIDKEPSLIQIWFESLVLGIGGFLLSRYRHWLVLVPLPIALLLHGCKYLSCAIHSSVLKSSEKQDMAMLFSHMYRWLLLYSFLQLALFLDGRELLNVQHDYSAVAILLANTPSGSWEIFQVQPASTRLIVFRIPHAAAGGCFRSNLQRGRLEQSPSCRRGYSERAGTGIGVGWT